MALPDRAFVEADRCKNGHDRLAVGRNKRGECRACVATHKRDQIAKNPDAPRLRQARWYAANKSKQSARARQSKYGISPIEFAALLEQQAGLCAICCEPMVPGKQTHVDHNHSTGEVRGLLCNSCNVGVGMFKDDFIRLTSAVAYLGAV
jgi:hypothetical protein